MLDALCHPAFIRLSDKKLIIIVTAHWNGFGVMPNALWAIGQFQSQNYGKAKFVAPQLVFGKTFKESNSCRLCSKPEKMIGTDDWLMLKILPSFNSIPGVFQGVVPTKPPFVATELGDFQRWQAPQVAKCDWITAGGVETSVMAVGACVHARASWG